MRFFWAGLIAFVLNGLLILAASQLVRDRASRPEITTPVAVSLVSAPREEAPPEASETKPPEPPQQKPTVDFMPDLPAPSLTAPTLGGPAVVLDASLAGRTAPLGDMTFEARDLDQAPRAVVRTPPQYPYRARQRHIEGSVTVRFLVGVDGRTSRISILAADPTGVFDQSVLAAVSSWRFEPGLLAGEPVAAWVDAPITFDLNGGG